MDNDQYWYERAKQYAYLLSRTMDGDDVFYESLKMFRRDLFVNEYDEWNNEV